VTMVVSCILLLLVLSLAEAGFSADKPAVWLGKTYQIMWDQNHGKQSYYPPPMTMVTDLSLLPAIPFASYRSP